MIRFTTSTYVTRKQKKIENDRLKTILLKQPWKLPHINHKSNFGSIMFSGFSCDVRDRLHERNDQLIKHLNDRTQPIMKPNIAYSSHMGCPIPVRTLQNLDGYYKQAMYRYGKKEANTHFV